MNTISVAINLPSVANATAWDFSSALQQAQSDATMRGDSMGAMAIARLQMLIRLPHIQPTEYYSGSQS
jgi:hypothetical protein